ncbi:hypothetical protein WR25_02799 [Diploscapter pachys]|uniref:DUF7596 domain-containing protein n=1 Tax=Diploscapter pachys TaxID=2018661 RepID=A0A2A2LXX4_9BILA|nr:hypothetical protein WR25_02799 [Diploscapter pachys]
MLKVGNIEILAKRSLAGQILDDSLLPINNNPAFIKSSFCLSVTIVQIDGVTPVAFGTITKQGNKQAYCMIDEADSQYDGLVVTVEEMPSQDDGQIILKIKTTAKPKDFSGERLFTQAFDSRDGERSLQQTILDTLVEKSIGMQECVNSTDPGLNKNITIDISASDDKTLNARLAKIRDDCGFIVTDRYQFQCVQIDRHSLIALEEKPDEDVTFERLNKDNKMALIDDYLTEIYRLVNKEMFAALCDTNGVDVILAMQGDIPCGAVLTFKHRILACYAEKEWIAGCLLAQAAHMMPNIFVTLFIQKDSSELVKRIVKGAASIQPVCRMHTVKNIPNIKWSQVFCPNLGLSIF